MNATQRLWARRAVRAGWLMAALLEIPLLIFRWIGSAIGWYFSFLGEEPFGFATSHVFLAFLIMIPYSLWERGHEKEPVPAAELAQAVHNSSCVKYYLIREMAKKDYDKTKPISHIQLETAQTECANYYASQDKIKEQAKALELLK